MKKNVKLLGMVAMFSVALASCTNDELKEVYQGEEISFTTRMTRAVPTTTENLQAFKVWAHAENYENMFMSDYLAKRIEGGNFFSVDHEGGAIFWPSGVNNIDFWAYGPFDKNGTGVAVTPAITKIGQALNGFVAEPSLEKGGNEHQDLIVAYTQANHSGTAGTTVSLNFKHALSQIEVKAKCPSTDKTVKIKGAWLMNVAKGGNLAFSADKSTEDYMLWTTSGSANYGVTFKEPTSLQSSQFIHLIGGTTDNTSLMLVPQTGTAWHKSNANNGVYILLLCRVEATHLGTEHVGSGDNAVGGPITVDKVEGTHTHQLFPYATAYDDSKYGYTCVAIAPDWVHGKKYVYNLEFCGLRSGAGLYPPITNADLATLKLPSENVILDRPEGKNVGDPVLDNPIRFDVKVTEWSAENVETPMN